MLKYGLILLLLAGTVSTTSAQSTSSAEIFSKLPFFDNPVLSPDGRYVATKTSHNKKLTVGVFKFNTVVDSSQEAPAMLYVDEPNYIEKYEWANNERLILRVKNMDVRRNRIYESSFGIASIDKSGSHFFYLTPQNTGVKIKQWLLNVVDLLENDHAHIVAMLDGSPFGGVKLHKVDIYTGKASIYEDSDIGADYFLLDKAGTPKLAVIHERKLENNILKFSMQLFKRDSPDLEWELVQSDELISKKLIPTKLHETDSDIVLVKPYYDESLLHDNDPSYTGLLEFSLSRQSITGTYRDTFADNIRTQVSKILPGQTVRLQSWNKDRNRFIIWAGQDDLPGAYYILDLVLNRLDKISSPYPELEDRKFSTTEKINYQTRDNYQIPAFLTTPEGKQKQGLPFIIYPHKFISNRDYPDYDRYVQFFSSLGYGVFRPQFRGTSGMGEAHMVAGIGELGGQIQDDVTDGVNWLIAEGIADPNRICIFGLYTGGYTAAFGLMQTPQLYRCGVSIDGLHDLDFLNRNYPDFNLLVSKDNKTNLKYLSLPNIADKLQDPLLLMVSKFDIGEEILQTRKFYNLLKKLKKDVELVELPDAYSWATNEDNELDKLLKIEAFLTRNLSGEASGNVNSN